MRFQAVLIYHSPSGIPVPEALRAFAERTGLRLLDTPDRTEVIALVNRSLPSCVVVQPGQTGEGIDLCRYLKHEAFSAIVPVVFLLPGAEEAQVAVALEAGADEVLTSPMSEREQLLRLHTVLQRADRDVSVNPTTRLPGTAQIERDMGERLRSGELFAVCYADLDHFKEFNDRYGYNEGDRVILMLSRILRDIVRAYAPTGFVGHIGGDDFIFNVPLEHMTVCCEEILEIFDELVPYQYSENDRRVGYFMAKDRRGMLRKIPIMTLSIGVVTNQHRLFTHTARISEVATEMKSYAKTLPGSVYAVDRRADNPPVILAAGPLFDSAEGQEGSGAG